jgi:transcriptional regulator with XRE-family HTH domain
MADREKNIIRFRLGRNIRRLRELKNKTMEQLADELGISTSGLHSYESGRTEPDSRMLIRLSKYFQVAIDAFLKCDLDRVPSAKLIRLDNNRLVFPITVDHEGNDLIEVVPVKARAGYLNGYSDPEFVGELPRMNLPFIPVGKHRAFPIKGDSMPPLKDGSWVVGKFVERWDDIRDGRTYIVLTRNEGLVYKRVVNKLKKERFLELHSDNPVYEAYKVKAEDILEVWEFSCAINTAEYKDEELNTESIMKMLKSLKVELGEIRKKK